jgi:hypothetical protein
MERIDFLMSNSELQDAIIKTATLILGCSSSAQRLPVLNAHLISLLNSQSSRANIGLATADSFKDIETKLRETL